MEGKRTMKRKESKQGFKNLECNITNSSSRGITLIALVVTIVVLAILSRSNFIKHI